jgi:hypothetical protein
MAQATNKDIREIKDLILGLDKKIDEVKTEIRGLDKKIDIIDIRLVEVEKKIDKQDTPLWAFGGIILAVCLGTIVKLLAFPKVISSNKYTQGCGFGSAQPPRVERLVLSDSRSKSKPG